MKKFSCCTPFKLLSIICLMLLCISVENCIAQSWKFNYATIPAQYQPSAADLAPYKQQAVAAKSGAYDLTKSLPQGYVTDGSVDYTKYIQLGVNSNTNVVFPNFPVLINHTGISLKSNSIVVFDEKSKLILIPSDAANYQMLSLYNVQNVKVYFPVLEGDRKKHIGNKGEWGMGISIVGTSNVEIINPKIASCWGDGIYVGKSPKTTSSNIKIDYAVLDYNRRNGISIVSVDGLTMLHPLICNTNGTVPMAGIDFEPNTSADVLSNILIDAPITFNSEYGIAVSIWGVLGKVDRDANIIIKNHIDDHSYVAFLYYAFRNANETNGLNGNIQIINPKWKNNKITFQRLGFSKNGPNVNFSNVSVINNKSGQDVSQPDSLKRMKRNFGNDVKIAFH